MNIQIININEEYGAIYINDQKILEGNPEEWELAVVLKLLNGAGNVSLHTLPMDAYNELKLQLPDDINEFNESLTDEKIVGKAKVTKFAKNQTTVKRKTKTGWVDVV